MRRFGAIFLLCVLAGAFPSALWAQDGKSVSRSDSCMIAAQMAYNNHQADSVKSLCRQAIELNPGNDAAYYMLARVALVEMNLEEAEKNLTAAVSLFTITKYH